MERILRYLADVCVCSSLSAVALLLDDHHPTKQTEINNESSYAILCFSPLLVFFFFFFFFSPLLSPLFSRRKAEVLVSLALHWIAPWLEMVLMCLSIIICPRARARVDFHNDALLQ